LKSPAHSLFNTRPLREPSIHLPIYIKLTYKSKYSIPQKQLRDIKHWLQSSKKYYFQSIKIKK